MSDSVQPHRWQPTRLTCPWDSPGKNTGVGCHFLLQCMKVKSEREVAQSCPTLNDSMNCSLPGSSIHGICQARHRQHIKKQRHYFANKVHLVKAMVFPVIMYGCDSWTIKKTAAAAARSLQSCPTLCDPIDCSPPGSSVHGIFQARTLEWVAFAFS